jgi:hypothetical protein
MSNLQSLINEANRHNRLAHWLIEKMYNGEKLTKRDIHDAMLHIRAACAAMQSVENMVCGLKPETKEEL